MWPVFFYESKFQFIKPQHSITCIHLRSVICGALTYKGWNFNSGNYLFTTDTK